MFSGIKLLCLKPGKGEKPWHKCLNPVIVKEELFLKIANKPFRCPSCGHDFSALKPYFLQLLELKKSTGKLKDSGFYIRNYALNIQSLYEDGIDVTAHVLEHNDWANWNMQISHYTLAHIEEPEIRFDLWEDHFFKGRPYIYPKQYALTFNGVLRRKSLFFIGYEFKKLDHLKVLIRETRRYNELWVNLINNWMTAVPLDLRDPFFISLNEVDNLAELYDETYE